MKPSQRPTPNVATISGQLSLRKPDPSGALTPQRLEKSPTDRCAAFMKRAHLLLKNERLKEAEGLLREAVALAASDSAPQRQLALVLMRQERHALALPLLKALLKKQPGDAALLLNLAVVMFRLNRGEEAKSVLTELLRLHPQHVQGRIYLANAFLHQPQRALDILRPLIDQGVSHADLSFILATLHERLQSPKEALQHYEAALTLKPNHADSLSNWLLTRHYVYPVDLDAVREKAVRHGLVLEQEAQAAGWVFSPSVRRPAAKRLKVGILSSDLRKHVVAYFLESVLQALAAQGVELFAYANHEASEQASDGIKACFARWHDIKQLPDLEAARLIAADDLDVLLDLNGHTNGRRLGVLQRKPAPRQVSWLGYFGTTGLPFIDAVIADPHCVPPDEARYFSEPLLYMPRSRLCLSAPKDAPPVAPQPPMASLPWITFGCFQNINKINDRVLALWRRVLDAVPASVLRLQSLRLDSDLKVLRLRERLCAAGIDTKRVWMGPALPRNAYLAQYAEIDVLLDTFPYPGGTTTAEAIWMGVPTLTLATPGMLGRQGQAMLNNVGLADWVAHSEDEYLSKAASLAQDKPGAILRLQTLRRELRNTAQRSALFDAQTFAKDLEQLLRNYCEQTAGQNVR